MVGFSPEKKAKEVCNAIHDKKENVEECETKLSKSYQEVLDLKHENPMPYHALPEPVAKTVGAGFAVDLPDKEMGRVTLMDKEHAERELEDAPAKVKKKIVKVTSEPEESEEIKLKV